MAKRRKTSRSTSSRSKKGWYKVETYGIKYNSLTFLLFLLFVVLAVVYFVSGYNFGVSY